MATGNTTANMERAPRLRLHFNVHEPIELVEMTYAFQSLGNEYQTFLREKYDVKERKNLDEIKLYITKIESNCILAELAPAISTLGAVAPFIESGQNVVEFVQNLKRAIDFMRGLAGRKVMPADDIPYGKRQVRNIANITSLAARNRGADLGLAAIHYEEDEERTVFSVRFSDEDCREAQAGAALAMHALESYEQADHTGVLMYFWQTNRDNPKTSGKTGDRAIIQSISDKPKRVHFVSNLDHERIRHLLDDRERNPLHTGVIVDVSVERDPGGTPRLYRILRIHEILEDDEDE